VTFRNRVIFSTVGVATVAVLLACFASFLTARTSLIASVDTSLHNAALLARPHTSGEDVRLSGAFSELVQANGTTTPKSTVPIDSVILQVASGTLGEQLRTVEINDSPFRELIVPVPKGTKVNCGEEYCETKSTSAQLFIINISGETNQLRHLIGTLLLVALGGVFLAFLIGTFIARTALRPLESVTNEIETVATTKDLSQRIAEGSNDELGRLRSTFNNLLTSVEDSQLLQRQLVLDASHELRTPLTSLRTNAQVMSRASELSEEDLNQLRADIITQVDELSVLITDLGELSRGERSEGEVVVLNLEECVQESVDTAKTYARIKHITIDAVLEQSSIPGRRDRLERAVSNLLTNAIKFTPENGRILVKTSNGSITVSDSGPGVNEEDRPFVFDRFWRAPSSRPLPGSGLGLSIVAQVVSEFNGVVVVDKDPELGGARFTINFPVI
jgi:two-component system, OmpR family, sensor histidine kinase MprB